MLTVNHLAMSADLLKLLVLCVNRTLSLVDEGYQLLVCDTVFSFTLSCAVIFAEQTEHRKENQRDVSNLSKYMYVVLYSRITYIRRIIADILLPIGYIDFQRAL